MLQPSPRRSRARAAARAAGRSSPAPLARAAPWPAPWAAACTGPALALLLIVSLLLRLWGIKQGLPYSYNSDEAHAFRPSCGRVLHPRLQPALLPQPAGLFLPAAHRVRAVVRLGRRGHARLHVRPDAGVRGRARRRGGARHGRGVADLPGGREVLQQRGRSDCSPRRSSGSRSCRSSTATWRSTTSPRSRPVSLALYGTAGVMRRGRMRDYAIAGAGIGLAAATKYTGGITILCLLTRVRDRCLRRLAAHARRGAARWRWRSAWSRS